MNRLKIGKYNRFLLRHRLLIFLVLLITLIIVFPFVYEYFEKLLGILEIFFAIVLIAAIYILSSNREILTICFFIAILTLTVIWFNVLLQNRSLMIFGLLLEILFFSLTTYVLLSHVMSYKRVTADKIYGTISGYLLLGMIWAMVFTVIEQLTPGSFSFQSGVDSYLLHDVGYPFTFARFIYFSFVTLTTLGYGDVIPVTAPARIFCAFEAIIGQLYIAVLISRIVGLHIGHSIMRKR